MLWGLFAPISSSQTCLYVPLTYSRLFISENGKDTSVIHILQSGPIFFPAWLLCVLFFGCKYCVLFLLAPSNVILWDFMEMDENVQFFSETNISFEHWAFERREKHLKRNMKWMWHFYSSNKPICTASVYMEWLNSENGNLVAKMCDCCREWRGKGSVTRI